MLHGPCSTLPLLHLPLLVTRKSWARGGHGGGRHLQPGLQDLQEAASSRASGEQQGLWQGGTVGLLLKQGSLHVYIKGKQVGTMVTGLTGELVWAADMDGSVRIARKPVPE